MTTSKKITITGLIILALTAFSFSSCAWLFLEQYPTQEHYAAILAEAAALTADGFTRAKLDTLLKDMKVSQVYDYELSISAGKITHKMIWSNEDAYNSSQNFTVTIQVVFDEATKMLDTTSSSYMFTS
jgi:hypothetical protein